MFGWIKRRRLARRCRQALQGVESYSAARARMAAVREAHNPPRPPAPLVEPAPGELLILGPDVDLDDLVRALRHPGRLHLVGLQ